MTAVGLALAGVLAMALLGATTLTAGGKSRPPIGDRPPISDQGEDRTYRPPPSIPPLGPNKVEITKPGDGHDIAVWRNGRIYKVRVGLRRYIVTSEDGSKAELVEEDHANAAASLPPHDPALEHLKPTPADREEMCRITGGTSATDNAGQPVCSPPSP